jgi:hypothetical protein
VQAVAAVQNMRAPTLLAILLCLLLALSPTKALIIGRPWLEFVALHSKWHTHAQQSNASQFT